MGERGPDEATWAGEARLTKDAPLDGTGTFSGRARRHRPTLVCACLRPSHPGHGSSEPGCFFLCLRVTLVHASNTSALGAGVAVAAAGFFRAAAVDRGAAKDLLVVRATSA